MGCCTIEAADGTCDILPSATCTLENVAHPTLRCALRRILKQDAH